METKTDMPADDRTSPDRAALLKRTPEQIAEDLESQREAQDRSGYVATDSIAIAQYKNALGAEQASRLALRVILDQIAEYCFWQGKFETASNVADDSNRHEEYLEYFYAYQHLNWPQCTCPPILMRQPNSAKGVEVSSSREVQRVYVGEIEKEVKFIRCDGCKKLFAQTA